MPDGDEARHVNRSERVCVKYRQKTLLGSQLSGKIRRTPLKPSDWTTRIVCGASRSPEDFSGTPSFATAHKPRSRPPTSYFMTPRDPLQQPCDPNRNPLQFHQLLIDSLRENEHRLGSIVSKLQSEDLAQLVHHLDNVSVRIIFYTFFNACP